MAETLEQKNQREFNNIHGVVGSLDKLRTGIWQQAGSTKTRTMWREVVEACAFAKQAVKDIAGLRALVEQVAAKQGVQVDNEKIAALVAEAVTAKFEEIEKTTTTTSVSLRDPAESSQEGEAK